MDTPRGPEPCPYCGDVRTHIGQIVVRNSVQVDTHQEYRFPHAERGGDRLGTISPGPTMNSTPYRGGGVDIERGCEGCRVTWQESLTFHKGSCYRTMTKLPGTWYPDSEGWLRGRA